MKKKVYYIFILFSLLVASRLFCVSQQYYIPGQEAKVDFKKPELFIAAPIDNYHTQDSKLFIKGKALYTEKLFINDISIPLRKDGVFNYTLVLSKPNSFYQIEIKALNSSKKETLVKKNIYYYLPIKPSFYSLTPENDLSIISDTFVIKGRVLNTSQLTINDQNVFLDANGNFSFNIKFVDEYKKHSFKLKALSADGIQVNKEFQIEYAPSKEPSIKILYPTEPAFITYKDKVLLKGETRYTKELYINNEKIDLDPNTGRFFLKYDLEPGVKKTFIFKAVSLDASKSVTVKQTVFYKAPIMPKLDIFLPALSPEEITKNIYEIRGKVSNVKALTINKQKVEINEDSFKYQVALGPEEGSYDFLVLATSVDNETLTKDIKINYRKPIDPELILFNPKQNFQTKKNIVLFKGIAKNTVLLTINNKQIDLNADNRFFVKLDLTIPNKPNLFTVVAKSKDQVEKIATRSVFYEVPSANIKKEYMPRTDTNTRQSPVFMQLKPSTNITTTQNSFAITGIVNNAKDVFINGKKVVLSAKGEFVYNINTLFPYIKNDFILTATSKEGGSTTKTFWIAFIPQNKPEILFEYPQKEITTVSEPQVTFQGIAKYATKLIINDTPIDINTQDYSFKAQFKLNLNQTTNNFKIVVESAEKLTTEYLRTIIYAKGGVQPQPKIILQNTSDRLALNTPIYVLKGKVKNTERLSINNVNIIISPENTFVYPINLSTIPNKEIAYNLEAVSSPNLIASKQVILKYTPKI